LRWDALSTLAYVANWREALTHQSYFAQYSDPSPLRHMWSLGIEEQYYLIFPVALLVWLAATSGRTRLLRVGLLVGVAASALIMLLLYDPKADPSRIYYGTDTRAQALFTGAFLAAWVMNHQVRPGARRYLQAGRAELRLPGWGLLGGLGLSAFVALLIVARDMSSWLYRGGFLLTAVVCAALIAGATRAGPGSLLSRALSWEPLRLIGVISYGLYLWHWPVYVVLTPDRTGMDGTALLALRFVTTFGLATLSYLVVERPIRRRVGLPALRGFRPWLATAGAAGLVAIAVFASTSGAASPVPAPVASGPIVAPAPTAVRVFVIGDSVSWVLWKEFQQATLPDLIVQGSTQLGCGLIAKPVVVGGQTEPLGPTCGSFDDRWPGEVAASRPDVAVLMLGIGEQFDREVDGRVVRFRTREYEKLLDREIAARVELLGGGLRPVVLVTVPCHAALENGVSQDPVIINDERRVQWLNDVQRRYVARHSDQVKLVDLHQFLCADGYSNSIHGVHELRSDGVHFTPAGVQMIWKWMGPQIIRFARDSHSG
jgi:peptidoglycan/LPS O-acetylase OafA/YrhL